MLIRSQRKTILYFFKIYVLPLAVCSRQVRGQPYARTYSILHILCSGLQAEQSISPLQLESIAHVIYDIF